MSDNNQTPSVPGAGRKLDALVHIKLGHSEWLTYESDIWEEDGEEHSEIFYEATDETVPDYSTDIGAAWEIVNFMRDKGYWFTFETHFIPASATDLDNKDVIFTEYAAEFYPAINLLIGERPEDYGQVADTAPHAICLAFLALPDEVAQ